MAAGRRSRCFMDVDVGSGNVSRIVFELYNESCPKTCENFRGLCTGEFGIGKTSNRPLHYKGSILHRVIKGFMIQGGDISGTSGRGGESIYGGLFEDENLNLTHDKPLLLSMANRGPNANGSQFFITTAAAPHLNSRNVVFGEVLSGENIIALIETVPVDRTSRPLTDIKVVKCGELVLTPKIKVKKKKKKTEGSDSGSSSSSDSSDSSDEEATHTKGHKKKAKKGVDKLVVLKEPKLEVHPLVSLTAIKAEDIPEVPMNRLFRKVDPDVDSKQRLLEKPGALDSVSNRDRYHVRNRNPDKDRNPSPDRNSVRGGNRSRSRVFVRGVTKSGRNIKGRGVFRYRTPSRSRSRSATPPHWKQAQSRTIKMAVFKQKTKEQIEFSQEVKRREQVRNARHSTIQHSKTQENSRLDIKDRLGKILTDHDSQASSNPQSAHKHSQAAKVASSPDHLSDLEEGETRDEEVIIKVEVDPSPSHTPLAVDYNALDYEAPLDSQEVATNGATGAEDSDKNTPESWDSKRISHSSPKEVDSKNKHRSSNMKEYSKNAKRLPTRSSKEEVVKLKDTNILKSRAEETPLQMAGKSDVHINRIHLEINQDSKSSKKENGDREERKKAENKKWLEMMKKKHEEELSRKKALEAGRRMLKQKKREKLRAIEKKKRR